LRVESESCQFSSFRGVLLSFVVPSLSSFPAALFSVLAFMVWGAGDFAGGCGSRRANAFVLTAFSHICAFMVMLAAALLWPGPFPDGVSIAWALAAGVIGGVGLAIFYGALASGQMGLTAPISAMLGAGIPTLIDIALEGAPSRWSVAGFALAIVAIWLITRPESKASDGAAGRPKGVAMAALAGVGFAGFYLCIHRAGIHQAGGATVSPLWVVVIARVGSFAATSAVVMATRVPIKLDAASASLGVMAGICDISANVLFVYASRRGRMDEAVVITSLYPAVTVLLARMFLKEHFSRWRAVGILAALAAVPLIAAG
jgi:drug/metabolite transporter (DMT)-like permease